MVYLKTIISALPEYRALFLLDQCLNNGIAQSHDEFDVHFRELKRYLFLRWRCGHLISLSGELEQMWKAFAAFPNEYSAFCIKHFGSEVPLDIVAPASFGHSNQRKFEGYYQTYFGNIPAIWLINRTRAQVA